MSKSSLVDCTILSPNHSGKRTHSIDRITPHCVVGQLSAKRIGECFAKGRNASCNYGIGKDGKVSLIVDETYRSWCSSSRSNDQRAVTIECASDLKSPYAMNKKVYNKLIDLCVDICKRNGKKKLIWIANKNKALAYNPKSDEMLITVHRWFANKPCPGDWLYSRLDDLANKVTTKLSGSPNKTTTTPQNTKSFKVKVIAKTLNVRKGAGILYPTVVTVKKNEVYTIAKVNKDWGKLKSGLGWINLKYTKRV